MSTWPTVEPDLRRALLASGRPARMVERVIAVPGAHVRHGRARARQRARAGMGAARRRGRPCKAAGEAHADYRRLASAVCGIMQQSHRGAAMIDPDTLDGCLSPASCGIIPLGGIVGDQGWLRSRPSGGSTCGMYHPGRGPRMLHSLFLLLR